MNREQEKAMHAKNHRTHYDSNLENMEKTIKMNMRTLQDEGYDGRLGMHLLGNDGKNNYLYDHDAMEIKREKK